jgi:four helix bundle protein
LGDYRRVAVWRRAHELTLAVYRASRKLPKEEHYGLTSQLRRAAASVPANIAEGCGRNSDAELAQFLGIALGSANELDYLFLLTHDLGYLPTGDYEPLANEAQEVTRMISGFISTIRRNIGTRSASSPQRLIADSR